MDVSTTPKTNYMWLWAHQDNQIIQENPESFFKHIMFINLKSSEVHIFIISEDTGARNPDGTFNEVLNILDMGSVSSRENEMRIWWNFETKKL